MLKGRESEGGESCGAVGPMESSADDGKGKGNGAAMSAAKGVGVGRPARTEDFATNFGLC